MSEESNWRRFEDKAMLRAEIRWLKNGPTLKMAGRLVGDWAEQARSLVTEDIIPKGLIVDLTEISSVDCVGEQLLKWLGSVGAEFVARSIYALDVCERLDLPLLVLRRSREGTAWRHAGRSRSNDSQNAPPLEEPGQN
jgi:hypothetical protein